MNLNVWGLTETRDDDRGSYEQFGGLWRGDFRTDDKYIFCGHNASRLSRYFYHVRWKLPVFRSSTINSAIIKSFCIGPGPLEDPRNSSPDFNVKVYYESSDDGVSLAYGTRRDWSTSYVTWWMSEANDFGMYEWVNSPDIKSLVQELVNRDGWKYNNHMVVRYDPYDANDEIWAFAAYDFGMQKGRGSSRLEVNYTIKGTKLTETLILTDAPSVEGEAPPPLNAVYLDNIMLHPTVRDYVTSDKYEEDVRVSILPDEFTLEDAITFDEARQLLSKAGKNVPVWYYGRSYNCIVSDLEIEYGKDFALVNISLVNTNKRKKV